MARRLNMAFVAQILIANLLHTSVAQLHTSVAQTTYVVGGNDSGWAVPTGISAYSDWAATKNFTVGDILVFNFSSGVHDVTKVTKFDYDACSTSNPISSTETGPANITLDAIREQYFICSFPGHCAAGQKLAVLIPGVAAQEKKDTRIRKILAIVLPLVGVTFLMILIFGALLISRRRKITQLLEEWEVLYGPYRFAYKDLFTATKGFKQKQILGRGGFGSVYKGTLPSSNVEIAVKRVSHDSRQGMREFVAEIATIGRLRHPKLVRLLGYCRRKGELFLVYDYMPNGSLDKFLYGQPNCMLNWSLRFKIIKDVASALFYLHEQWVQVVIHRDIKPANILIDNQMNARLGDFGLAKLCDHGNDPQSSHVAGTFGYIAPELARTGKATTSSDLYAFGVFMLEVACGRRPVNPRASPEEVILTDWVMDSWDKGAILDTVDHRLGNEFVAHEVELVLKLGLLCSHAVAAARPSMSGVMQFLDGSSQLPDNLNLVIKTRDFNDGGEVGAPQDVPAERISIPPVTLTESFLSRGR